MEEYRVRVRIFIGIILFATGILGVQLFQLQIINQDQFREVSRGNALRDIRVVPARGAVYDRNGLLMVHNQPTYTVTLTPRYFDESKTGLLAELLETPDSVVIAKLAEARQWSLYRPSPSFRNVPFAIYSRIQENAYRLPGVGKEIDQKRRYLTQARAAHALGYIREIAQNELDRLKEQGAEAKYRPGDLVGKTGVERHYEAYLRGTPGSAFRVVNVHGLEVKSYRDGEEDTPPSSGYDIHLTLDSDLQVLAESLFVAKRGAAVAIDPNTGGILALVSKPDFDPALFSQKVEPATWRYLNNSPEKPLYNRATMNLMPPGSTWKPFMALLSLEEGNIAQEGANSTFFCPGYHPVGRGQYFRCLGVHGHVDVRNAIKNSCNTFFFEMARRTNVGTFEKYANLFGFGIEAPTDIGEQTAGLIPDSAYFNRLDPNWDVGYTMNLGIGQGNMGVTPLQLARYIAAVANKGTLYPPHLVDRLVHPETHEVVRPLLPAPEPILIDEQYFDVVRDGMRLVMEQGSGALAQIPGLLSGGKTGTAQASGGMQDHSVFVLFAPFDDPKIAIAVQAEHAGQGAHAAAPIASLLAEFYLKGELPDTYETRFRMNRALNARSQELPGARQQADQNEPLPEVAGGGG